MTKFDKKFKIFLRDNDLNRYLTKKYFDYGLTLLSILLGFFLNWEIQNILVFSFVIWIILNPIASRILARIALYCLAFIPLLLLINRVDRAEQLAILAYYFLILTIITGMIEFKKEQNLKPKLVGKRK